MAITKLLRLKESRSGNKASHLKHNLFYICDPAKTGGGAWIGGNAGSVPEIIYDTMIQNKKNWGKEEGSQGFHYVISFPPELDISHETICKIAEDFAQRLLGGRFYYAYAVHDDHRHKHVHITFDSVSFVDGYKFHSPKSDWEKRIQPITDKLCRKYNIPTLEYNKENPRGKDYDTWEYDSKNRKTEVTGNEKTRKEKPQKDSRITWNDIIRDDIDEAIRQAESYEEFKSILVNEYHYEIRDNKYLSLRPFGKEKAIRSTRLGEDYEIENIVERIKKGRKGYIHKAYGSAVVQRAVFERTRDGWKMTGYQAAFFSHYHYCRNIRHPMYADTWKHKKDLLNIMEYGKQASYIIHHDIRSEEDLDKRIKNLESERKKLKRAGDTLRKKMQPGGSYYYIKKLIRLMEERSKFPDGTRPDLEKEIAKYKELIAEGSDLKVAVSDYQKTEKQLQQFDFAMSAVKEELDLCERIRKMKFHEFKYKNEWLYPPSDRIRITVNRKLYAQFENGDFFICRIPGSSEYIKIPREDTYVFNEKTTSAYLYDSADYEIVDQYDKHVRLSKGEEIKTYFSNRTGKKYSKVKLSNSGTADKI